jgi:ecotin
MRLLLSVLIATFVGALTCIAQTNNMKAFPAPGRGVIRYVWNPPQEANENELKVEILVGRNAEVDQVNRHFLSGSLTETIIDGWGFPKYVVRTNGVIGGTLMAVSPEQPKVMQFVTLRTDPQLFRYNSKLPVVVYAPRGIIVKFRVWRPDATVIEGRQG